MSIHISELKFGDLVFPYTGKGPPGIFGHSGPASHVTIVTYAEKGVVRHTHQVEGSKRSGTWETDLQPTERKASNNIRVVRCNKEALRETAQIFANYWACQYLVPFGSGRRNAASSFEQTAKAKGMDTVGQHRKLFREVGMFRAIKFAARRESFLCYPGDSETEGNGLFCSMFVTLCYQIAGLLEAVKPADKLDRKLRVSDKKVANVDEVLPFILHKFSKAESALGFLRDIKLYQRYTQFLQQPDFYKLVKYEGAAKGKRNGLTYMPCIAFWDFDKYPSIDNFPWMEKITEGMMVDSKMIMPQTLFESLVSDPVGWTDLGDLAGEKYPKSQYEKPGHIDVMQEIHRKQREHFRGGMPKG